MRPSLGWLACFFLMVLASTNRAGFAQTVSADEAARRLEPFFHVPKSLEGDLGNSRSPLLFEDGTRVQTADDWQRRRAEIRAQWIDWMGPWPQVLEAPSWKVLSESQEEGYRRQRVELQIAEDQTSEGWLLIPSSATAGSAASSGKPARYPAVLVVYYDPETSIGVNPRQPHRDFALQLVRQGFVTLSLGTPGGDAYKPTLGNARCQPLSFHAYVAANAWQALARLPEVDPARIGVTGHSYGGKWALFAGALWEPFAAVAVSDPGIMFDETRPSINYWEPWYLGRGPASESARQPGLPTADNPSTGAYRKIVAGGHDLHEIHALLAPRPFFVSGGSEDPVERWRPLQHLIAINRLLGHSHRVAMTNRPEHDPNPESNAILVSFFVNFLRERPSR